MLSRVANSIYWMARYVERAENIARIIEVNLNLLLDLPLEEVNQWEPLVQTTGDHKDFIKRYGEANQENVIRFLTFDLNNPNSIRSCINQARENARTIRDVISTEMWEEINSYYHMVQASIMGDEILDASHAFFKRVKNASHRFAGITDGTMTHNEAWHFIQLGRLSERADKTARILDVKYFILLPDEETVGTSLDITLWSTLLKSVSAFQMYRQHYHYINPSTVAEFLILNREFPRSMHYCLINAENSLHAITGSAAGTFINRAEKKLGRMRAQLDFTNIDEIITGGMHEYLDDFQLELNNLGDSLNDAFFTLHEMEAV